MGQGTRSEGENICVSDQDHWLGLYHAVQAVASEKIFAGAPLIQPKEKVVVVPIDPKDYHTVKLLT